MAGLRIAQILNFFFLWPCRVAEPTPWPSEVVWPPQGLNPHLIFFFLSSLTLWGGRTHFQAK